MLRRFKWGVSRVLMETEGGRGGEAPLIIPIWIKGELHYVSVLLASHRTDLLCIVGFEEVMNEERTFPRFLPRTGKKVTVIIGEPINDAVEPLLAEYQRKFPDPWRPVTYGRDVAEDLKAEPAGLADMRSRIADALRTELMKLGEKVGEVEAREPTKIEWQWRAS